MAEAKLAEPKRIRKLRETMVRDLPFFPNDRVTRDGLLTLSLNSLLIHWMHWKTRMVAPRPRAVHICPSVTSDRRWKSLRPGVENLASKVRAGVDLSPHLSDRVFRYGYTPRTEQPGEAIDRWSDKDFLLNAKSFYHFHLGIDIKPSRVSAAGLADRTDEVLFAFVDREKFTAIGIFDHSVFDFADAASQISLERDRMYKLYEQFTTAGMKPGTVYLPGRLIATSGHPVDVVMAGDRYAATIRHVDATLDTAEGLAELYDNIRHPRPKKPKFQWAFNHLDLGLFEQSEGVFIEFMKGPT